MNTYEKKIMNEIEGDYESNFILIPLGQCEFCGHKSKMGYEVVHKITKKVLKVGTTCVYTLVNLNKQQKRILDNIIKKQKHDLKYASIKKYLEAKHKDELITSNQSYNRQHHCHDEIINETEEWVFYKVVDDETKEVYANTQSTKEKYYSVNYIVDYSYHSVQTQKNVVSQILNKINNTQSNINNYWFETYKELTSVDLKNLK